MRKRLCHTWAALGEGECQREVRTMLDCWYHERSSDELW